MKAIGIVVFIIVGVVSMTVFNNKRQGFFFFALAAFVAAVVVSPNSPVQTISRLLLLISVFLLAVAVFYKAKPEIFISYKSADAEPVRRTAEILIANGMKVWFAEYEVLLNNYDLFDRAIRRGVSKASAFICFTRDAYVQSQYCCQELEQFLSRRRPHKSIVEIRMAEDALPHIKYPVLATCPSTSFQNEDEAAEFILCAHQRAMRTSAPPPYRIVNSATFSVGQDVFSMDLGRWNFTSVNRIYRCGDSLTGDILVGSFQAEVGEIEITGNLFTGTWVDSPRLWNPDVDDREAYRYAIDFARYFYHERRWWRLLERPIGLHLVFNGGLSHSAITTKSWLWQWTRRYSLVLPLPRARKYCEFTFLFFGKGSWEQFCGAARFMDSIVCSLAPVRP